MLIFDEIYNQYWDDDGNFTLCEKKRRTADLVRYMLNRSQQIFKWSGLPKTIPSHNLEYLLQVCGNACITEVTEIPDTANGEPGLYAFFGGLGGMLNAYYEPTIYTIANPYLRFNKELQIGVDCVRARNDKNSMGLIPMFSKYASMLNENEISLNMLAINYRIDNLISADDDRTYNSALAYLKDIVSGKFGVISSSEFFEGIKADKSGTTNKNIKDLIEYEQYLKASWYNEIGLNSNYNMKRERILNAEAQLNDDALIPLVENMLEWRLKAIEDIKQLYGDRYDLSELNVTLNPLWDLDSIYTSIPESEDVENDTNTDNLSNSTTNIPDVGGDDNINPETETETETKTENVTDNETDKENTNDDTETETDEPQETTVNITINVETDTANIESEVGADGNTNDNETDEIN